MLPVGESLRSVPPLLSLLPSSVDGRPFPEALVDAQSTDVRDLGSAKTTTLD